jgi:signal peptidase II
MPQRRTVQSIAFCLVALVAMTVLDLWTKDWAQERLSVAPSVAQGPACTPDKNGRFSSQRRGSDIIELVPNYLALRYAENCGAAFGTLDEAPRALRVVLFTSAALIACGALLWMFVRGHGGPLFAASVPLIASGAIGNMIDRLRLGYVVDFIHFHVYDKFHWPTFNIADTTITIGVALLLLDGLRRPEGETKAEARPERAGTGSA